MNEATGTEYNREERKDGMKHLASEIATVINSYGNGHSANFSNGDIRHFPSGAIRDNDSNKEDYIETISWRAMKRYAQYMTSKKSKYGAGNFKKHIPIDSYEQSLLRHIQKYLANKYEGGNEEVDQDHLSAMLFNIFGIIYEQETNK